MSTIGDVAKFRYGTSGKLIEITGYFYLCDSKLNQLLRSKDKDIDGNVLDANAPVFYAVLMSEKDQGEAQRNIHFRFDKYNTIYHMEPVSTEPNEAGAFIYKCIFFSEAKFIYIDGGYPALEDWNEDKNVEVTTTTKLFDEWLDYKMDNNHKFISTLEHTIHFYH